MKPSKSGLVSRRTKEKQNKKQKAPKGHLLSKNSEKYFQAILDATSDAIALSDKSGIVIAANPAYLTLYGYDRKDILGKKFSIIFPEKKRKEVEEKYALLFHTGQASTKIENIITRTDGLCRIVECKYDFIYEKGERVAMVSSIRDITQRKVSEEELQTSKAQIEAVFDSIKDGVVVTDMQGNFILVNQAQAKINCFKDTEEMLHTFAEYENLYSFWDLEGTSIPFKDWPLARVLRGESIIDLVVKGRRNDIGKEWYFSFSGEPVRDEKGRQMMAVVITRDITLQKVAEDKLRRSQEEIKLLNEQLEKRVIERTFQLNSANKELKRSNKELEDFAYIASHDLQEPLRKIKSFSSLLSAKYKNLLPGEAGVYLSAMEKASNRMSCLINDLLTYSRVATNTASFVEVDLSGVISEVLEDLQSRIEETGAKVRLRKISSLEGDALQLRLLFQNLISNALKYKRDESPVIDISCTEHKNTCIFQVRDNGIGFDEKYLDKIFIIFQRLHGRGKFEGTGVGLAICKKIVDRHGGEITAKSRIGKGSTFIVSLPKKH